MKKLKNFLSKSIDTFAMKYWTVYAVKCEFILNCFREFFFFLMITELCHPGHPTPVHVTVDLPII